ncbi:hypothetical protein FORC52_3931 [Salmonella enterica subsp. enterica serovar Enteritidis]|nr:hypothetical protein SeD_A4904 [Salmonella enterica subsp. enterica serovar Dublin str. CT_02021853]ACN48686.1 hypothetical protein SPC_4639 [Salmonella enterica subsp. enterica serovar Paratyphi C str. RKS4594]ACY91737.1 hypothetical protein STM14_5406 [Salmonella enterica subsp. enterica serovar Typhimurium str. 14028S]ADX20272.1 hypothetical protein STM474_4704 [Salmonella enterica subsp. enterica serovar Typhimurium str. ST4/74]AET56694.1 hypothetical protein SPUL_4491 [Salmonella enteri
MIALSLSQTGSSLFKFVQTSEFFVLPSVFLVMSCSVQ